VWAVKCTKFGDDRLIGLGVVSNQISASSMGLSGRPQNKLRECDA